jgi:hypothetical protein
MSERQRLCRKCKKGEPEIIFVGYSKKHNICKECLAKESREWRKKNPKKALEIKKRWKKKRPELQAAQKRRWRIKHYVPKPRKKAISKEEKNARVRVWKQTHPEHGTLIQCRRRAKRKRFECTISESWIKKHTGTHCEDFPWIEFKRGEKIWCNASPSVDRIDNTKGYNPRNSRVVSMLANRLKGKKPMNVWLPIRNQIRVLYKVCAA